MAPLPPFEQSYSFRLNVNKGSRATTEIIAVRIRSMGQIAGYYFHVVVLWVKLQARATASNL